MRLLRLAPLLSLLAPALAAAQAQPAGQEPGASTSILQPGTAQTLAADFSGGTPAQDWSSVPSAGAPALVTPPAPAKTATATAGRRAEPDWAFTTGKLCTPSDPGFKEYRYAEQIPYCQRNITQQMKQEISAHYGVPQSDWPNYEFDHLIPLSIGGDSHVDNIWPQPHGFPDGSNGKDKLEMKLYLQMKKGSINQAAALRQIQLWFQGQSQVDDGTDPTPPPPGPNPAD